ncbi:MAG TPA: transcriptional regulator [Gammaproteobacteria bacterium]|nr:transcriptional regulator [Gammaproteobacteria bacterium]
MTTEPAWLCALREACDRTSQAAVGRQIGYSATVVNQVLKGKYTGDLARVESAINGALLGVTLDCPVLGDLNLHKCLEIQMQPFAATNPLRVKLFKACKRCPHNRTGSES